ncbi:MAG: helix-turn-helix domain-containing protein [Pleomorphochaeta sp.]
MPFLVIFIYNIIHSKSNNTSDGLHDFLLIWGGSFSVLSYGIIIFRDILKYNKHIDNQFSSHETNITLSWLKGLSIGYIILFATSFLTLFLFRPNFLHIPRILTDYLPAEFILNIPLAFFILDFILHCPTQKVITIDKALPIKKPETTTLKANTELIENTEKLKSFMQENEPFLDSELTLDKLSMQIGISRHKLSNIITEGCNSTFYNFINKYRINKFEELIVNGEHNNFSIIGLAYECGFKGSSSFYNAMKKEKNITPKQLIKQIESAS